MPEGDDLLAMALELLKRADNEPDPKKRAAFEALAEDYRAQAEEVRRRGGGLTIEFELPPKKLN